MSTLTPGRRFRRTLLALVLASLALPGSAAARHGLCGIVPPLDPLFCSPHGTEPEPEPEPEPARPAAPAPSPPAAPAGGSESSASAASVAADPTVEPFSLGPSPQFDRTRIIVRFRRGTPAATITRELARARVTLERKLAAIRLVVVRVEPSRQEEAIDILLASRHVLDAESDVLASRLDVQPDDAAWSRQWGLRLVGLPRAWDLTRGSTRVVIAVIDTGVDARNADLRGALVPGYDFVNNDADPEDDHSHGTAVAGIAAGRANDRVGVAGICWECRVMPVKVLAADGMGSTSTIAAGVIWAVDHGAQVLNLSLGATATTSAMTDATRYARSKGAVVIAAAGNDGTTAQLYPAADPGAVSVAATNEGDRLYPWSNRGAWVALSAPGCNFAPKLGGGIVDFCGTSSSTPVVSGIAGLLFGAREGTTAEQVIDALQRFAVPIAGGGGGRVSAAESVSALYAPRQVKDTHTQVVAANRPLVRRIVTGGGPVVVTVRPASVRRFTLTVRDARGRLVGRHTASRSLTLTRQLAAGTYEFRLTAVRPVRCTLELGYVVPPG